MSDFTQDEAITGLNMISNGLGALGAEQQEMMKQKLAAGQKLFEGMQKDKEEYFKLAGNKDFPNTIRVGFYNNAAALDKKLGGGGFPAIEKFDDGVGEILDAFGTLDNDKNIDPQSAAKFKKQLIAMHSKQYGSKDNTEFLQKVLTDAQAAKDVEVKKELGETVKIGTIDTIIGKVDQALVENGLLSSGLASLTKIVPGTPARNMAGTISTIKANLGFEQLQAMREASPTGGALGQVAVQELEALQSAVSALDQGQSPAQLNRNFKEISNRYSKWRQIVTQAKGEPINPLPKPGVVNTGAFSDAEKEKRYQQWKASQGK